MTGPHDTDDAESAATRPISVAELLAKNGTIGSPPVTGRRRRRRGNSDSVSVAELTGEIPVISDDEDEHPPAADEHAGRPNGSASDRPADDSGAADPVATVWSEPRPRWPESPSQRPPGPELQRSGYPLPTRRSAAENDADAESGAERMSPDPGDDYADGEVDVMDTGVDDAASGTDDSVRSYLHAPRRLFGRWRRSAGPTDDELAEMVDDGPSDDELVELVDDDSVELDAELAELDELAELAEPDELAELAEPDEDHADIEADLVDDAQELPHESLGARLLRGGLVVLQSILAVAFGAGLFVGFDQLWRWNNIVALVLSVLVTLGLVTAVQVVRKTVDTTSTLIAVAVGLLITLGPLALLRSG
jgi:hypothetical protein